MGGYGEIVHAIAFVIPREIGPAQTMGKLGWLGSEVWFSGRVSFVFVCF